MIVTLLATIISATLFAPAGNSETDVEAINWLLDPTRPYEPLWKAVCEVESSNNVFAVNEDEQAYGISQIRQIRLDDYNNRTGKNITLTDCFDYNVSREVFMYYALMYDTSEFETIARRWNGSGQMTVVYWGKVKSRI